MPLGMEGGLSINSKPQWMVTWFTGVKPLGFIFKKMHLKTGFNYYSLYLILKYRLQS